MQVLSPSCFGYKCSGIEITAAPLFFPFYFPTIFTNWWCSFAPSNNVIDGAFRSCPILWCHREMMSRWACSLTSLDLNILKIEGILSSRQPWTEWRTLGKKRVYARFSWWHSKCLPNLRIKGKVDPMICVIPNNQPEIRYYTEKWLSKKGGIVLYLLSSSDSEAHLVCSSVQIFF